jgi:zinc-ribbon domain
MHCPNCGAENDASHRFCVNCGSELSAKKDPAASPRSPKDRLAQLVGTTPRARLITAATGVAILVAVVAFLSLDSDDDATGSSPYLQRLDRACVTEKERIIALEQQTLSGGTPDLQAFASVLVSSLAEWRQNLRLEPPPPSAAAAVDSLEAALVETLIRSGRLARSIREEAAVDAISRQAEEVDEATTGVDRVIENLDLSNCADLQVSPAGIQP